MWNVANRIWKVKRDTQNEAVISCVPHSTLHTPRSRNQGFTLVEMLVAVSLFAVVMTVSVGALLALVDANRKAQAMQSVMNNLNVALDGMVRAIRMGSDYHCGTAGESNKSTLGTPNDCASGGALIALEPFGGTTSNDDQLVYWFYDGQLYRSTDSKDTALSLTAPEVRIDNFSVFVTGANATLSGGGDTNQPKVVLVVQGTAGVQTGGVLGTKQKIETNFNIQAVASQRVLDI